MPAIAVQLSDEDLLAEFRRRWPKAADLATVDSEELISELLGRFDFGVIGLEQIPRKGLRIPVFKSAGNESACVGLSQQLAQYLTEQAMATNRRNADEI